MSNKITPIGILLTMLIMSFFGSLVFAQETPSQQPTINPEIATEYEANCKIILDYLKLFNNHNNASKKTVKDIQQTIKDIAEDRGCLNSPSNNLKLENTKLQADKTVEK